jgi:hypothetical protein
LNQKLIIDNFQIDRLFHLSDCITCFFLSLQKVTLRVDFTHSPVICAEDLLNGLTGSKRANKKPHLK